MKVLWFSLSPCGSLRRSKSVRVIQGWLISLEDELKQYKDIELHVAYFSATEDEAFDFEGVHYHPMLLKNSRYGLIRVLERWQSMSSVDRRMLPVMLDVVKAVNPDLIHIHGTEERFGLIQDYIKNIPIAFSIQGLIAPYKEKYFSGIPKTDAYKYESFYDKIRHVSIKDDFANFEYRAKREELYLSKAKYILGRTFWDRNVTLALNPERKYFMADEVMRAPFYTKKWNRTAWSQGKFIITSTISGGIYKGFETALRAARILNEFSKIDFEWNIVGYDNKSKWVDIASKLTGLNPKTMNVRLLGRMDADHLAQKLTETDIYVHVSHIENSPNSVCEAMLVGAPIISTFAGGTAALLKNGIEGELVQDGDPYALAGAIVDYYQHFDKAKEYSASARNTALVRHDAKRIVDELVKTYDSILNDFKSR